MSPTPHDDASPIRSYPIMVSPPLWPERPVCVWCGREKRPDEKPWPTPLVCPECKEEDDDE